MQKQLHARGFALCSNPEEADFVLLNTCAFIEAAVEESLDTLMELAALERVKEGKARLLVTGCLPSRYGEKLSGELPEVTAFVPVDGEANIAEVLAGLVKQEQLDPIPALQEDLLLDTAFSAEPWAYVKISDGCSRRCSYCTIPLIRGAYHSYSYEKIQAEVSELIAEGAQEIILIGQDTGIWREPRRGHKKSAAATTDDIAALDSSIEPGDSASADSSVTSTASVSTGAIASPYSSVTPDASVPAGIPAVPTISAPAGSSAAAGHPALVNLDAVSTATPQSDTVSSASLPIWERLTALSPSGKSGLPDAPDNLPDLLDALATAHPHTWFRVMYLQPEGVTDALLKVMAQHTNIASYLDIPLQHASRDVLGRMHRSGSGEEYLELVCRIRKVLPDVTLRTTVMCGFPGETREDFELLCDFLTKARFDYVGVFAYSREEGTVAAELPHQVSIKTALLRAQKLRDLADRIGFERAEERIGAEVDVLICGSDEEGVYGRTQAQAPEVDGVTYLAGDEKSLSCNPVVIHARIVESVLYDLYAEV